MCCGDTNLEWRELDSKTGRARTSGHTVHQCRNFRELFEFAENWRVWNGKKRSEQTPISPDDDAIVREKIDYDLISPHDGDVSTQIRRNGR